MTYYAISEVTHDGVLYCTGDALPDDLGAKQVAALAGVLSSVRPPMGDSVDAALATAARLRGSVSNAIDPRNREAVLEVLAGAGLEHAPQGLVRMLERVMKGAVSLDGLALAPVIRARLPSVLAE